jgi:uncharacterized protein (DUF983 family)
LLFCLFMNYQETKLYSILNNKCPRCHEGNFWVINNPYDLKNFSKMNDRCPVCNEDFKRETGYYFGAAYVSYGLTVAFGIFLYMALYGIFNVDVIPFLITFSVLLIALLPVFYRLSRIIWINMFVHYKKKKKEI